MTVEQMRNLAISINDDRLNGITTREVHARHIAFVGQILASAGLTWEDLA